MDVQDRVQIEKLNEHLKYRVSRLQKMLNMDAPNFILAREVNLVWQISSILFGEELYRVLGEEQSKAIRMGFALCQTCDTELDSSTSYFPVCDHCKTIVEEEQQEFINSSKTYE